MKLCQRSGLQDGLKQSNKCLTYLTFHKYYKYYDDDDDDQLFICIRIMIVRYFLYLSDEASQSQTKQQAGSVALISFGVPMNHFIAG